MEELVDIKADLGVAQIEARYQEGVASGHHMQDSASPTEQLFCGAVLAIKRSQTRLAQAIARSVSTEMSTYLRTAIATVTTDEFVDEKALAQGTEPVLNYLESNLVMVDKWLTVETMGLILELFWEELMNSVYDVLLGTPEHPVISVRLKAHKHPPAGGLPEVTDGGSNPAATSRRNAVARCCLVYFC